MKDLIVRMAGAALVLAAPGCQREALAPAVPAAQFEISTSATTQNIAGTVSDPIGDGIAGMHVRFFDASNGEILGDVITTSHGTYDSGPVPIGEARIRVGDREPGYGSTYYPPEFVGAGDLDDFCSASVVTVAPSTTTVVDDMMKPSGPTLVVLRSGNVQGTVLDRGTGDPVPGIQVVLRDAANALAIATTITDASGYYYLGVKGVPTTSVRVRFSDPSVAYLPQYFGAAGTDEFCGGTALALDGTRMTADASLVEVPPDALTEILLDTVDDFGLTDDVSTMLVTPLTRLEAILSDGNTANEASACGQLKGFLSRVDVDEKRGVLTSEQADALRAQTAMLQQALGCV